MLAYTLRRVLLMIPTLLVISFVTFAIIQLPPGDYLSNQIIELRSQGDSAAVERAQFLRQQFGLDKPFIEQYLQNKSRMEVAQAELKTLRSAAKIEYVGDFQKPVEGADAAPAAAPSLEQQATQAPAAPGVDAAQPAQGQPQGQDFLEKGLNGLKK